MRMDSANRPVEDKPLSVPVTYADFPVPTMPGGTPRGGPTVVKLKTLGRPQMTNPKTFAIPHDSARRIARATTAHPGMGVYEAMDIFYALPTSLFDDQPFARYLATDKAAIAEAQRRTRNEFDLDIT
jgi:hypothetical protein